MNWKSLAILIVGLSIFTSSWAEPEQIDVIGLVPGVSTLEQVKKLCRKEGEPRHCDNKKNEDYWGYFVIGGYKTPCNASFLGGYLSKFACLVNKYTKDAVDSSPVSKDEVLATLVKGFRNKLGSESENINDKQVEWRDKKGNTLIITNLPIGGILEMESAQKIKNDSLKEEAKERQRKF